MTKWVRIPGPGQFRGEGDWAKFDDQFPMSQFLSMRLRCEKMDRSRERVVATGYLPAKELPEGGAP